MIWELINDTTLFNALVCTNANGDLAIRCIEQADAGDQLLPHSQNELTRSPNWEKFKHFVKRDGNGNWAIVLNKSTDASVPTAAQVQSFTNLTAEAKLLALGGLVGTTNGLRLAVTT